MTIRLNTLLVSWYEGVYLKDSVEGKIGGETRTGLIGKFSGGWKNGLKYDCGRYPM